MQFYSHATVDYQTNHMNYRCKQSEFTTDNGNGYDLIDFIDFNLSVRYQIDELNRFFFPQFHLIDTNNCNLISVSLFNLKL